MTNNKVIIFFLLMLVGHVAHIFEEVWGNFKAIAIFKDLGLFLAVNLLLFCLPICLFYFVLHKKKWAYKLSMIYAGIMIINGFIHNITMIVTGSYFGGFAGGISGVWLIVIGTILIYHLRKEIQSRY